MKYLKQLFIILTISFLGEILHAVLPLPVPAGIYGLVLMLLALFTKVIKLSQVNEAGDMILDIMPVLLVPASVSLMDSYVHLSGIAVPVVATSFLTTFIVMFVTGRVTQWILGKGGGDHE